MASKKKSSSKKKAPKKKKGPSAAQKKAYYKLVEKAYNRTRLALKKHNPSALKD